MKDIVKIACGIILGFYVYERLINKEQETEPAHNTHAIGFSLPEDGEF